MIRSMVVAALALAVAQPTESQVHPITDLPEGPVVFVAPGGALVIAPAQVAEDRATLASGDTVLVLEPGRWRLGLEWFDPETRESRGTLPPVMRVGARLELCAVVLAGDADEEVAVSHGCGCVYPDALELWEGAVDFTSGDPGVVTVAPGTMCAGAER